MNEEPTYEELKDKVRQLEKLLEKRTRQLSDELKASIRISADLEKRSFELNQRIIELKAVLEMTTLSDNPNLKLSDFYREVLKIVVASFQFPEITGAEMRVENEVVRTDNYRETAWKMGRGLMEGENMFGYLRVCYLESKPEKDFGPFTKEEKNLLVVLTRYLSQIIKRKQFEEKLDKFQQVISQSRSMIMITDKMGRPEYVNEMFIEKIGVTLDKIRGSQYIMVPDDTEGRDSLKKVGRELISHGTFNGELVVVCVDGTRMQVRASVTPILRKSEVEYYVAVFDDITEEIGLRELNRANQEKLNAIMDNIPVSITLMDSDGRFTFYNRQAQNNLAFTEEELKNKTIVELFPREGPTTLKAIRRIFREKKPSFTEVTYQTQTGLRHYEINRLPLFDASGAVHNVMSIANDITRKRYEEKVIRIQRAVDSLASIAETFEDSLKILFDNLFELDWLDGGGLYMVDPENKCLQLVFHRGLSARFIQKVKSYPLDSAQGLAVLSRLPYYSQAGKFIESSQPHLFQEKLKLIAVLPLVFHDTVVGALNLASRTAEQLDDFDRQAIEAIALKVANLIELIRTREELTLTNVQLKKQMEEIREKQDLLIQKSKLESLGELAAGMAHEISQPLSVISLAFENILYKLQEHQGLSEYFTRKSNTINLNIEKIRQLIDHIRVFSRDQATVMFEKVDINQAIHNSLEMISEQMKKNHIAVSLDLSPNRCYTLGNLTKVEQVMMNLISNARDAIEEKAASKSAKHYIKKISISSICEKERLLIVVEDNGTGIAPENQDKLMNPFFTTKPPGQGTGLGLSIVFGIITEMKGTIDITSEFHNFTRITITLPKI